MLWEKQTKTYIDTDTHTRTCARSQTQKHWNDYIFVKLFDHLKKIHDFLSTLIKTEEFAVPKKVLKRESKVLKALRAFKALK